MSKFDKIIYVSLSIMAYLNIFVGMVVIHVGNYDKAAALTAFACFLLLARPRGNPDD